MLHRASQTLADPETGPLEASTHNKVRLQCLVISLVCAIVSLGAVVIETMALFNIQYCDGEDLATLYWASWTLLQAGSLIAILGISLNQWYDLNHQKPPPWNVALGTPVLVVAAFAHAWQSCVRSLWQKWRGNGEDATSTRAMAINRRYVSF